MKIINAGFVLLICFLLMLGICGGSGSRNIVAVYNDTKMRRFNISKAGLTSFEEMGTASTSWKSIVGVGDVTGDGRGDVVVITNSGEFNLETATSNGILSAPKMMGFGYT